MKVYTEAIELVIAPERWWVDLATGESLEVLAHGYSIEEGRHVFSLLFRGQPNFEVTALSIPSELVVGLHY